MMFPEDQRNAGLLLVGLMVALIMFIAACMDYSQRVG